MLRCVPRKFFKSNSILRVVGSSCTWYTYILTYNGKPSTVLKYLRYIPKYLDRSQAVGGELGSVWATFSAQLRKLMCWVGRVDGVECARRSWSVRERERESVCVCVEGMVHVRVDVLLKLLIRMAA